MTLKETAIALGVTVRTVQRYTQAGRLAVRQEPGKTRPTPVYDAAAVHAFKAELARTPYARQPVRPVLDTDTLTLRLDADTLEMLARTGASRGLSAGQYARELLLAALENPVDAQLARLRSDLASATYAILAYGGKVTPEEAERWVSENLEQQRLEQSRLEPARAADKE